MVKSGFNITSFSATVLLYGIVAWAGISCTGDRMQDRRQILPKSELRNTPMVTGEAGPPDNIKSIQLYRGTQKASVPAIELGSNDYITLRFDELGEPGKMFRVRVQHRNADWSASDIMKDFYLSGYREDLISNNTPSIVQDPHYMHYRYRFPNDNMQVTMSGNYLLEIFDYESSRKLFSIPFFVYEDEGHIEFNVEELYGLDSRYLVHHQPFVQYHYPSFVISPITDLRLKLVQNRFWGRARNADIEDMSKAGVYRSYLSRSNAFAGVYEFRPLNLRRYNDPDPNIVEVRPETIPPRVQLFRDVVNLDVNPQRRSSSLHGLPRDDSRARYVDVRFELELPAREATDLPIYVYGPFNNWIISDEFRMEYRASTDTYTGRALIKEGNYDYKYAVVEDRRIDDLRLDASFASTNQEYTALVYYWDPEQQADRLLQMYTGQTK